MKKAFLMDQLITVGFLSIALIFGSIFLVMLAIPRAMIVTMIVVYGLFIASWLLVKYVVAKRKIRRLATIIQHAEQPYLIGEMLQQPTAYLEQQYYELLKVISKDAIERVEQADRDATQYKEFVEQWIHEFKTPLTAMNLIVANDGDTRKLRKELKRLDNLTDQVLHFARLQSIEKDKQFEHFAVAPLLNAIVKNQMDVLIAARMQVVITGDAMLYTDQKAVQFIVTQLLINSAKYCPGSTITMTLSEQTFTYEDNGIGILPHELPRIFERGYTGTNGRQLGTSTGMGLYIVANLCKELHIQLLAEAEVQQFTRFTLTFPAI